MLFRRHHHSSCLVSPLLLSSLRLSSSTTTPPSTATKPPRLQKTTSLTPENKLSPDVRYAKSKRAVLFEGKIPEDDESALDRLIIPRTLWKDHPDNEAKRKQRQLMKKAAAENNTNDNNSNKLNIIKDEDRFLQEMLISRIFDTSLPPLRIGEIFHKVTTPWRLLDEYNVSSRRKRLQRLSTVLRFLQDHNILLHAVFRYHEQENTWNVTPHYSRLVSIGETKIASDVALRLSKVFPYATLDQLQQIERKVIDVDYLAEELFDAANLNRLVQPKDARKLLPLTNDQKATLICAMVAELGMFVARTKATDRTHNNALFPPSDALILHVLAAHAVEEIMGDVIAGMFQARSPLMRGLRENWRNFYTSTVEQVPLIASKRITKNKVNSLTKEVVELVEDSEEFRGCFAEVVEESVANNAKKTKSDSANANNNNKGALLDEVLNYRSALQLNQAPRKSPLEQEKEQKKIDDTKKLFESGDLNSLFGVKQELKSEKKLGGFFSPTPAEIKWEKMMSSSSIVEGAPICYVPGLKQKVEE